MGYKYKNDIKDFMWSMFWMSHDTQKADIDQLEDDKDLDTNDNSEDSRTA